jgi:polysaccharide deacetylase family protein (PEP-CTERM system associated)
MPGAFLAEVAREMTTVPRAHRKAGAPAAGRTAAADAAAGRHFFTVDVEEHFQVSAFEHVVDRDSWATRESRVMTNVERLLDLLGRYRVRGTFFILGWLAERQPAVARRIADDGHEVASHGQDHQRLTRQTVAEFRQSAARSKAVLEDVTGREVLGFRAPSFSIVPGLEWSFDVLLEEGYRYDSSVFPVRRSREYGYPGAPRDPHWIQRPGGRLLELPLTTLRRVGVNLPASGGAYFRIFPYALTRAAFAQCEMRQAPGTFYVHPWEVDPEQPRLAASLSARLRHYTGLGRTVRRLERLLGEFRFTSIGDRLAELTDSPA